MDFSKPPSDIPPDRLFRLLLTVPRPTVGLPSNPSLRVQAIHPDELVEATESGVDMAPSVIVSYCLLDGKSRVFASADEASEMRDDEFRILWREVSDLLSKISPIEALCVDDLWHSSLCFGAEHRSNVRRTASLGCCFEEGDGLLLPRPERYFGLPSHQLLDGHWMAWRAARAVWDKWSNRKRS